MGSMIRLQGYGMTKAQKAEDFHIGDMMLWNFGHKSLVTGVVNETANFITFAIEENGKPFERRLRKDRLVAIG